MREKLIDIEEDRNIDQIDGNISFSNQQRSSQDNSMTKELEKQKKKNEVNEMVII